MTTPTKKRLEDHYDNICRVLKAIVSPLYETFMGFWERKMPVPVFITHYVLSALLILQFDLWLLRLIQLRGLGEFFLSYRVTYFFTVSLSPFFLWGAKQVFDKIRIKKILERDFEETGLKTVRGRTPKLISIRAVDDISSCINLNLNGVTAYDFREKKDQLASRLGIYISQIQEDRTKGTLKLTYTNDPIPDLEPLGNPADYKNYTLPIGYGAGRRPYVISLEEVPHLLVGGSTQMGKSTFFRQAITCLYFGNMPDIKLTVIDLKEGMESNLFDHIDKITTISSVTPAVRALSQALDELELRAKLLAHNGCQNIAQYNKKPVGERKSLGGFDVKETIPRHVIFIDEAAELFLTTKNSRSDESSNAKRICRKIAAQGRAVGVHLVIGTQRPDASTIDMSIKGNMTGRLCFFATDNASSMVILDSGRASDLSHELKGRAIWRNGAELQEVQTPLLTPEKAIELFKILKKNPAESEKIESRPKENCPEQKSTEAPHVEAHLQGAMND